MYIQLQSCMHVACIIGMDSFQYKKHYNYSIIPLHEVAKTISVQLALVQWEIRHKILLLFEAISKMTIRLCVGNSSVDKIYIIRPKPGPVAKNATPRPSGWESNPRPLDY